MGTAAVHNPCSCCCPFMRCGVDGDGLPIWPETLEFVVSIAGSCSQAATMVLTGTVCSSGTDCGQDMGAGPSDCDDEPPEGQTYCDNVVPNMCLCFYAWEIATEDIPLCGPYIRRISLQCIPTPTDAEEYQPPTGCDHQRYDRCLWYCQVEVDRTDALLIDAPVDCGPLGDPPVPQHPVQDCLDCTWDCAPGAGDPECCAECPPCVANCPDHIDRLCADDQICCDEDGCNACVCDPPGNPCQGECSPCTHCYEMIEAVNPADASCDCAANMVIARLHHFWGTTCATGQMDIEGCNPTSCPPDEDNYGDFYLMLGCDPENPDGGDFIEFACPTAELELLGAFGEMLTGVGGETIIGG